MTSTQDTDRTSDLWRVGRRVPVHVYAGDTPLFTAPSEEIAAKIVADHNAALAPASAPASSDPVAFVSEDQLALHVGGYLPTRKTAEGLFQTPIYTADDIASAVASATARLRAERDGWKTAWEALRLQLTGRAEAAERQVEALRAVVELFVKQWNACGPNSDFGRYFITVRRAAIEALSTQPPKPIDDRPGGFDGPTGAD